MIVLGAQHKRFFDSTIIGTTTVRVTRHAPCPVMTIISKAVSPEVE
ncbi:MAG: universal stress protein [Acidobacteria bacterium]|nr:universal stress protein [Acidobacteriota bacterium]